MAAVVRFGSSHRFTSDVLSEAMCLLLAAKASSESNDADEADSSLGLPPSHMIVVFICSSLAAL